MGELRGHENLHILSPSKSPHLPPLLSAADKPCHVCRRLPGFGDDSPLPPPATRERSAQDFGEGELLRLPACSARPVLMLSESSMWQLSLPGFHMTASSPESRSREGKIAVRVGVRREQSGMGRWRGEEV